jgi:ABC-type uncharacterized transport system auxiliary subunit
MRRFSRRWPAVAAAATASALALSACGSLFTSREPPQSVYLLTTAPVPANAQIPADLTILRPQVRPGLDTSLIAALYPDGRLDHFAGARWSAPLDEVVEDLALQAFRADAHAQRVHTDVSAFGTGYWLEIDVEDFQAEYGGLQSAGGRGPPTVHVRLLARLGASGDRLTAIVDAYGRAASAALGKIVADAAQSLCGGH